MGEKLKSVVVAARTPLWLDVLEVRPPIEVRLDEVREVERRVVDEFLTLLLRDEVFSKGRSRPMKGTPSRMPTKSTEPTPSKRFTSEAALLPSVSPMAGVSVEEVLPEPVLLLPVPVLPEPIDPLPPCPVLS